MSHHSEHHGISMIPGAFSKPCEYVGRSGSVDVYYGIVSLNVESSTFLSLSLCMWVTVAFE